MKREIAPPAERLAGIEWMRALAAFGVIAIHSGVAVHNRTTPPTEIVREGFGFAVPFFLVTSFFFAIRAEKGRWIPWGAWLKRYAERLLIPFVFWSAIYLTLHVVKLMAHHQTGQIAGLFADPAALILSGGTSLALYFLPLLFTGLVSIHLLSPLFKRAPVYLLGICFLVALGLHEMCSRHGFDYDMNSTGTGPAPLRLLVCLLEEAVRCSPLIFAAGILTRTLPGPTGRNALPLIVVGALLIVSVRLPGLSGAFEEPAWGIGTFLLAWALSGLIPASHLATLAGLYSFGVYLIHQIFLESIQVLVTPAKPVGVLGILAITMAVYVASMLAVALANRIGSPLVRKIVGLK